MLAVANMDGIKCINFPMWGNLCTGQGLKFSPYTIYFPPPCTLPSSVHCPVHLHTGPAPSVYTAFLLMPCQLRFEPATMVSQRINLITNWGKFCTCCCLGENFALFVPMDGCVQDICTLFNVVNEIILKLLACKPMTNNA